eukprot:TRINITY_DN32428_c0_g1_i2.p1 TRINITY_DN32428_c0_g1~~TRINITY_DN32428_c0_g1_i2.p1  ORF type:complete len:246 (-),score=50.11 TRINITY_DN32428_c0_g1_i2:39-725(-)
MTEPLQATRALRVRDDDSDLARDAAMRAVSARHPLASCLRETSASVNFETRPCCAAKSLMNSESLLAAARDGDIAKVQALLLVRANPASVDANGIEVWEYAVMNEDMCKVIEEFDDQARSRHARRKELAEMDFEVQMAAAVRASDVQGVMNLLGEGVPIRAHPANIRTLVQQNPVMAKAIVEREVGLKAVQNQNRKAEAATRLKAEAKEKEAAAAKAAAHGHHKRSPR